GPHPKTFHGGHHTRARGAACADLAAAGQEVPRAVRHADTVEQPRVPAEADRVEAAGRRRPLRESPEACGRTRAACRCARELAAEGGAGGWAHAGPGPGRAAC